MDATRAPQTSAASSGQGRLAQVIASRGGRADPEAPFVIEHRRDSATSRGWHDAVRRSLIAPAGGGVPALGGGRQAGEPLPKCHGANITEEPTTMILAEARAQGTEEYGCE